MMVIPGYKIISKIYESAASLVYRGIREEDRQPVILKALKAEYPTPEEIARYKLEYEITHKLNLSGTLRAYSLEKYHNSLVIVLDDFGGESVKTWIKHRKFNLTEFLHLAIQITEILGGIHAANIIHKDINPSNIVYNPATGQVKIIDFGISTVLSRENPTIRNPNLLEGTLAYISPEQTGRMNRSIDYRSDFYSLGATFYEMLTEQQPFDTSDAIELVHYHIAKVPVFPHKVNPEIPPAVANIVMKLLAKTAEERYQSTWGINADLAECLNKLETTGTIAEFPLASQDISDKFQISQKLYGREPEVATLLAAFNRVTGLGNHSPSANTKAQIEMMLVAGYSGIGKSALVQEIYQPITQQRGYFIAGKFDQLQRNIPYTALLQAFSSLVRQLLTESEAQITAWREQLQGALGVNGQVIVDVIPEVKLILGEQPPVPEVGPVEAQNRLNFVFQNFLKVFAQPEHPLVIFLDDLQWADGASLKLIQQMMTAGDSEYLLLIGAYRDNEVNAAHPLMLAVDEMEKAGAVVNRILLAPLATENVTDLIADTFNCEPEKVTPLAELVFQKTAGNPFFMNEFLKSLYAEGLLHFDFQQGGWQWHLEQIQAAPLAGNVVDLMAGKIQKLSAKTQEVLKLAACIGNQFDLKTLSVVGESSQVETAAELWPAVAAGLIVPMGSEYKFVPVAETGFLEETQFLAQYQFVHDRVQQAAYSLIPAERKRTFHRQIGQILLENTPAEAREEKIFDIVNQLNFGAQLLTTQLEKDDLAQLNLVAAEKAKASAAFEPAFEYLQAGIALLGTDSWQTQYYLTLTLYEQAAEAAYLNADFAEMEKYVDAVLSQGKTVLDKVAVYEVKIQAYTTQSQFFEAIDIGLEVLQLLGVRLPKKPSKLDVLLGLMHTKLAIGRRPIPSLADLPQITNPHHIASMRMLSRIIPATYFTAPMLLPLIAFMLVNLSLKWGNSPESAHGYSIYGVLLCGIMGDIGSGNELGNMALQLTSNFNNYTVQFRVNLAVYPAISHWTQSLKSTLPFLLKTYTSALEYGDLEYAAYATHFYSLSAFLGGKFLNKLNKRIAIYTDVVAHLGQARTVDFNKPIHQAIINLIVPSDRPGDLMGVACRETEMLPLLQKHNDRTVICYIYFCKLMLFYLFDEVEQALVNAELTAQYLDGVTSLIIVPHFHFYDSLARLAAATNAPRSEQKRLMGKVKANQKKMRKWAYYAPANNLQKLYLVEAERYRILGQNLLAMAMYDQAIAAARANEYIHEEALAQELAAKFYLVNGKTKVAAVYMQDARYCYQLWGALAKVKDLEQRYPDLLARNSSGSRLPTISTTTTVATTSDTGHTSALDLAAVMKANQAIAEEILLDKLLSKLMQIMIENAGAQKGFLILESNGQLLIEASGEVDTGSVTVLQSIPIDGVLPAAIVNYVARTKESVVIDDAAGEIQNSNSQIPNLNDPYILENQPKSVLCAPLLNQGKLTGILYLENNLAAKAFTPERLEVLKILSGPAAISLENAKLYSQLEDYNRTLEQKVAERTTELAAAYEEITLLNQRLQAENIRMAAELDVTRQLQQMILPKADELRQIQPLEIAGFMEPAAEVGGDYYDILPHSGQVKIAIGDVTGHGLEAGMLMIMAQTAVRTLLESQETDQVKFLEILNRTLYKNLGRMNSDKNMTLALLDYCDGTVAIAGQHEEVLVVRADGEIELIDTIDLGFPIGLEPEISQFISQTQVKLNSGDGLVLYTDGITEATNMAGAQYGRDRLCQVVQNSWHQSASAIRQAALEDLRQHIGEQKVFDDITLVVLKQK